MATMDSDKQDGLGERLRVRESLVRLPIRDGHHDSVRRGDRDVERDVSRTHFEEGIRSGRVGDLRYSGRWGLSECDEHLKWRLVRDGVGLARVDGKLEHLHALADLRDGLPIEFVGLDDPVEPRGDVTAKFDFDDRVARHDATR